MNFSYTDIRSGNATCTLEIDRKKFEFYPSFGVDALGDFVTQLAAIHPLCKLSWKEGAFSKSNDGVLWNTEPRALRWEFKRDFEDLTITITEYPDFYLRPGQTYNKGQLIVKATCSFQEFVGCVVKELDRIIKQRGILGYRQVWQKDTFPLDGFLALKHAYLYNKPFEITKNDSSTSLEEEIKLLLIDV